MTQRLCIMNLKCQFYESFCSTPHEFLSCPLGLSKKKKKTQYFSILVLNIGEWLTQDSSYLRKALWFQVTVSPLSIQESQRPKALTKTKYWPRQISISHNQTRDCHFIVVLNYLIFSKSGIHCSWENRLLAKSC